jgi:yersiniabactin nonribosomal peptide synthetase
MEISRMPGTGDVIHFSLDCILLDAFSTQKMMGDLFDLYEGKQVTFPRLTFREYMQKAELWAEEKSTREKAEAYWLEKLQDIPPAPKLPYCKELSEIQHPEFARKRYEFSKEETQAFMQKAKRYHVTENAVVTYCFLDTLAEYCGQKELSLNLTMYSRYPVTEEADTILGDFTNTSILPYKRCESIPAAIREVENHMLQSVEHNGCTGIELVKQLGKIRNEDVLMPVVMTSMLQDVEMTNFKEVYSLSRTPQVVLGGQANYRSNQLHLGFDYVPEAFEEVWIEEFFKGLTDKMKQLIEMDDWKLRGGAKCRKKN